MQFFFFFVIVTGLLLAQDGAPKPAKDQLKQGREILQRAQRAMGGAEKLAAVKDSMHKMEIAFEPAAGGFKMKQTSLFVAPDRIRQEQEMPLGKYITYSDGKTGWIYTAETSVRYRTQGSDLDINRGQQKAGANKAGKPHQKQICG